VEKLRSILSHFALECAGFLVVAIGVCLRKYREKLLSGSNQPAGLMEVQTIKGKAMAGQYGLKETKEVLDFISAGVAAGVAIGADGKVDVQDLGQLLTVIPSVGPAFDSIALVPKEVGELDDADALELIAYVGAKLVLPGDKAKIVLNHSLRMAHKAYEIYLEAKLMKAELAAVV
jgi:hypothetical protein